MFKNIKLFLLTISSTILLAIDLDQLSMEDGFSINIFAEGLDAPRQMSEGNNGVIFVGERSGQIIALIDTDNNGAADTKIVVADNLTYSTGLSLYDGDLFFSEISKIWKIENIEDWILALNFAVQDIQKVDRLKRKGLERAKHFKWSASADQVWKSFKEILPDEF